MKYYDTESEAFYTENEMYEIYKSEVDNKNDYPFKLWLRNVTDKNGTIEIINDNNLF